MAGVVCLLLICAANIVGLVLARTSRRSGELAVRNALGASRARLVIQLSVETGVLVALGTVGGILLAALTLGALPALLVADLPPSTTLALDLRVILWAAGVGALCALAIGVWPALQASRHVGAGANQLASRHTAGRTARRTRQALAIAEVALALTLLIGSGLMARSFWLMSHTDPGFTAEGLFATGVGFSGARYPTAAHRMTFVDDALTQLSALPAVSSVAAVNRVPFGGSNTLVGIEIEGQPFVDDRPVTVDRRVATPGYFDTLDLKILDGRGFGPQDTPASTDRVAILNDAAARFIPAGSPLGRRVRLMLRGGPGPWLRVVGVVANVRHHGLGEPLAPEIYVPYAQAPVESMVFVMRSAADPLGLAAPVRDTLKRLDPDMRVLESQQALMVDLIWESVAEPRLHAILINGFAALALTLATIGIVGIVSYTVAQERRDIGVRLALGAEHGQVVRRVVRNGMVLVGAGAALGLAGGLLVARLLEGLLFGVTSTDPMTMVGAVGVVLVIGWIAAFVPARRISSIEPIEILRPE
jgi:putative ABC transport system permease protein